MRAESNVLLFSFLGARCVARANVTFALQHPLNATPVRTNKHMTATEREREHTR